ncbi:MAG: tetratricopeptide repeat protein [Cystobacter sp.]
MSTGNNPLNDALAAGHIDDVEQGARRRLGQNPGDPEALLAMAKVGLVRGRLEEAEALLARAASKAPPREVALVRASLAARKGDWDAARAGYEALTREPQPPAEAWYGLGLALAAKGDLPGSCEALHKAVELHPTQPAFRFELGRALTLSRQPRAAVHHLVRGLRLDATDARGYRVVADILQDLGHPRLARGVVALGLGHCPDAPLLREALGEAPPAPAIDPREEPLIQQVGALRERGRHAEALKLLREASEKGPRTLGLKLLEAETNESLLPPNIAGAQQAYEEAIALEPGAWVAYSNLGLFLLRRGGQREVPRAIAVLEAARLHGPTRPEPALNLALAYARGGREADALAMAELLVKGLPETHPLCAQARQFAESLREPGPRD